jgi:phosphoenolpyruvate-protein kinase (PTS system EI component)
MNINDYWRLSDRPPMEEIAKRTAEAGAGMAAAAKAIALEGMRANGHEYRQRVRDSHALGMRLLGYDVGENGNGAMSSGAGDIVVTGDVYGDEAVNALRKRVMGMAPQPAPAKTNNPLVAAALGAALLAGGMAIPKFLEKPPAPPVPVETTERPLSYEATDIEAVQIYQPPN